MEDKQPTVYPYIPNQNAGASLLSCPVVGIRAERKHSVTPELTHLENWCMI